MGKTRTNHWWDRFPLKSEHRWLNYLLLLTPAAIALSLAHASPLAVFGVTALAIAPLAGILGESTGNSSLLFRPCGGRPAERNPWQRD